MRLTSKDFDHMKRIPRRFTCQGININPQLEIHEISSKVKSLVLIVDDPDVPLVVRQDGMWVHWVLYNLLPDTTTLLEGTKLGTSGINTSKEKKYMGPCPPDKEHRYFFKLYALDTITNFEEGLSKDEIFSRIKDHIIDYAELIGTYEQD